MLRSFEKKIEKFIAESIPDPIKLVFFYGLVFWLGYVAGTYGYDNYEEALKVMCQLS